MISATTKPDSSQPAADMAVDLFDNWFDLLESEVRARAREFIEEMIRGELDTVLARPRYSRSQMAGNEGRAGIAGHRHGSRTRSLTGTFGPIEIAMPRARLTAACRDVETATLAHNGSPPITRTTFPTCRAHYPGGSSGCTCRLLPRSYSLPQMAGGSASALSLSRPAQASLTLRPARLLSRLKRPSSRGSSPASCPTEPLVSFQTNRQLSGWNLPPLIVRAFGAHGQKAASRTLNR